MPLYVGQCPADAGDFKLVNRTNGRIEIGRVEVMRSRNVIGVVLITGFKGSPGRWTNNKQPIKPQQAKQSSNPQLSWKVFLGGCEVTFGEWSRGVAAWRVIGGGRWCRHASVWLAADRDCVTHEFVDYLFC